MVRVKKIQQICLNLLVRFTKKQCFIYLLSIESLIRNTINCQSETNITLIIDDG